MPAEDLPPDLTASSLGYVEGLYEQYLADPGSVDAQWHATFANWRAGHNGHAGSGGGAGGGGIGPRFARRSVFNPAGVGRASSNGHPVAGNGHASQALTAGGPPRDASLQHRVDLLVRNYRVRGHMAARLNPLATEPPALPPELRPEYYGFTDADMDTPFVFTSTVPGDEVRTLRDIIQQLQDTYCRYIGVQFMHIDDLDERRWLQRQMESTRNTVELTRKEQIRILTRLTDAVIFEEFIQRKFIGAKSFSAEGAESLIPLLDIALEAAGDMGVQEVVMGMAHRGRLNVLANIIGKSPQKIFREFEDVDPQLYIGGGDVKYHMGYSGDWRTRTGHNIHLSMCFNPSHLEFVNPVAMGRLRAKQDRTGLETRGERGMCLLVHGDAAFAGEGIVQETLNLSQLPGYEVGGTLHIIVNNQIGFTTGPEEARSTRYASDVAKMLQSPIFHVNGEVPEAVAQTVRLALDYRRQYRRDVVIDMYCFRRRGHNEGDEPSYTQPKMYAAIEARPSVREVYLEHLLKLGGLSRDDAERIAKRRTTLLEKELNAARSDAYIPRRQKPRGLWAGYDGGLESTAADPDTGVAVDRLQELLHKTMALPDGMTLHPKLQRLMKIKAGMADGERPLDWAAGEILAFATLATEGHRIRITGQDAQRGTFSHRHAVLHDPETGREHMPLQHLSEDQAPVHIYNSPLSEAGVLGYEYGYSLDYPCGLIVWEAQFGDFVNVAQPIIDQFITSAEDKWNRLSGLVMLLPHGFEGQGPEHSSARLERFLTQCAEDNIQVCNPTTPAQFFHLLRRQIARRWRKPLIVMTPKSLLRHPACVSSLEDLASGSFQRVLADEVVEPGEVRKVLLCSGKIYYELADRREKLERDDVTILRMEQYYPLPVDSLRRALEGVGQDVPIVWVQEEPENQGAWPYLRQRYCESILDSHPFTGIARKASASPATGSKAAHAIEQERLLERAFVPGVNS
jgi:2-oxoglutarate dehydrogenase E1 component